MSLEWHRPLKAVLGYALALRVAVPALSETLGTKFCTIFSAIFNEIIIEYIPNSLL
ncbi:hypothetical protein T11_6261 [Trichinella zimbabwensis]|uniref:Uncharacterized protein n=1 Tax=Trichinella zimbabwensis TaxID=268475 RepID=A0A0V1GRL8_9BILA|nr:hypothetical protein T11_6261 [Trichinella zimbabwensis]